jgi:hypothetical protein
MLGDRADGPGRERQLGLWGWVVALVCLQESREGQVQVLASVAASGVGVSGQYNVLRHMTEGGLWCLSLDLSSLAKVTAPDPCSKTDKEVLLHAFVGLLEVGVTAGVGCKLKPTLPVFGPKCFVH